MSGTFKIDTILTALYDAHIIKNLLKTFHHFRMEFNQFGKSETITLAGTRIAPNEVNITNLLMVQCAGSLSVLQL